MTGLVRKALLLSAAGLAVAGAAMAAVPNVGFSTEPVWVDVVGYTNPPDPYGTFSFTIKDGTNIAIPFAEVVLDFSDCTDVSLCTINTTVVPSGSFVCATKRWTGTADVNGVVTFTIVGGGNNNGNAPRAIQDCLQVFVNGTSFPRIRVSVFNHSGEGGIGGPDLTVFASDFTASLGGFYRARSDYSRDGLSVGGPDLTIFTLKYNESLGGTGSALGCGLTPPNNCP